MSSSTDLKKNDLSYHTKINRSGHENRTPLFSVPVSLSPQHNYFSAKVDKRLGPRTGHRVLLATSNYAFGSGIVGIDFKKKKSRYW